MTGAGADVTGFDAIKAVAVAANAPVGNEDLLAVERDVLVVLAVVACCSFTFKIRTVGEQRTPQA